MHCTVQCTFESNPSLASDPGRPPCPANLDQDIFQSNLRRTQIATGRCTLFFDSPLAQFGNWSFLLFSFAQVDICAPLCCLVCHDITLTPRGDIRPLARHFLRNQNRATVCDEKGRKRQMRNTRKGQKFSFVASRCRPLVAEPHCRSAFWPTYIWLDGADLF